MQHQFSILPGVILSHLPNGVAVLSGDDLTLRYANPAFKRRFLADGTDFDIERFGALFVSRAPQSIASTVRRTARDGRNRSLHELEMRADGSSTPISYWNIDCVPVHLIDGDIDAVVLICHDVTGQVVHRRQAEQRAREAEERERVLEAVVRHAPEGLAVVEGNDMVIRHMSDYGLALARCSPEELIGKPVRDVTVPWQFLDPETKQPLDSTQRPLSEAVRRGAIITDRRVHVRGPDGSERWISCNAGPVRDPRGAVIGGVFAWRDITKLKQAEEALQKSEARFRLAQELSVDGFMLLRSRRDDSNAITDFVIDYANPAAQRAFAAPSSKACGGLLSALVADPQARAELTTRFARVVETGEPAEFELHMGSGDDSRWFRHVAVKMEDGLASSFTDITALKNAERTARERTERLKLALDSAPVLLLIRDRDLRMTWCSKPRGPIGGDTGLYGTVPEQTYLPEQAAEMRELYRSVLESGKNARKLMQLTAGHFKGPRWFDISARPLRDANGNIVGTVSAVYDVTELIEARIALSKREEWLSLALKAAAMGAWECEVGSDQVRHTESLTALFGLPPSSGPTSAMAMLACVQPDDAKRLYQEFERGIAAGEAEIHTEFRVLRPDGSVRWLRLLARIERDDAGHAKRAFGVTYDISEVKRTMDSLSRSNAELQRFAAVVAHDLKSPLHSVVGFGHLLSRTARPRLNETEQTQLDYILEAGRQMSELIDGLLDYAFAAHADRPSTPVDLEQVLAQVLSRLDGSIRETDAKICHDPLPVVPGHAPLLAQALQNLIGNALKFRNGQPHIHIGARATPEGWIVSVRDNGIGVPPEDQARIFDAFQRAHEGGYPGRGLGLAVVKNAVERHGGCVWLESTPGKGSTFYLRLPDPALSSTAKSTGERAASVH